MESDMWAQTMEMAKRYDSGGWLQLKNDGDRAKVVFLGQPYPREVCFVDNKYLAVTPTLRAEGHRVSVRVAFAVALLDTREVKVFEQGLGFVKDLVQVKEKYGLDRSAFEIRRVGAARDPKTKYSILLERQLAPNEQALFASLAVPNLRALYADAPANGAPPAATNTTTTPHGAVSAGGFPSGSAGAAAFVDPHTAQQLVSALKMLPRESIDRFLAHFGVPQIKLVPAARTEEARYFVEALSAEFALRQQAAAQQEVDPFA